MREKDAVVSVKMGNILGECEEAFKGIRLLCLALFKSIFTATL